MELPPPEKWPAIGVALFVVIAVGDELSSAKSGAISTVLSEAFPLLGPGLNGDPAAAITVIMLGWVAMVLFIAIPGRLGLFNLLRP